MNNNSVNWIELLINILLASFGGVVKKLVDYEKNPRRKIGIGLYVSSAIMSLFVGIIVYFVCKNYNVPMFLTMALTAIAGFVGTPAIYMIMSLISKKLHIKENSNNDNNNGESGGGTE